MGRGVALVGAKRFGVATELVVVKRLVVAEVAGRGRVFVRTTGSFCAKMFSAAKAKTAGAKILKYMRSGTGVRAKSNSESGF